MLRRACDGYFICAIKRAAASQRNKRKSQRSLRRAYIWKREFVFPTIEAAMAARAYIKRRRAEFLKERECCREIAVKSKS